VIDMTVYSKAFAICRMYIQAVETKNTELKIRFEGRANDLYRETFGTQYSQTPLREHILFGIACGETDFFFLEDVRAMMKVLRKI
jgi:hypothetical protein